MAVVCRCWRVGGGISLGGSLHTWLHAAVTATASLCCCVIVIIIIITIIITMTAVVMMR